MQISYVPPVDHHGLLSKKRMHLQPMLPIPVTYETAAIPSYAPFGTEFTPGHTMKIIGSRRIAYPESMLPQAEIRSTKAVDPDITPTKALQHVQQVDYSQWPQQSKTRFDTTYRTEFINRLRHPDQIARPIRNYKNSFNQYSVLPPIATKPPPPTNANTYLNRHEPSARSHVTDTRSHISRDSDLPPPHFNGPIVPPPPPMPVQEPPRQINPEDTYLPQEPVLLTDYEEQRLAEQIREQLGTGNIIERLKIFFQELTSYDPQMTMFVHYSTIQLLAQQLGFNLREDTLRFAMCKFVSPSRARGMVNYEDMVRYFGKCLSSIHPNPYGPYHSSSFPGYYHEGSPSRHQQNSQLQYSHQYHPDQRSRLRSTSAHTDIDSIGYEDGQEEAFDPDERRIRVLLKQNLKYFDVDGSIDFEKLTRELQKIDRDQSGLLQRQQIEEVVYKVRIPLQRSLIYQILEKHCKAYLSVYRWQSFVQYLREQVLDLKQVHDRSSPIYTQRKPSRTQWLDRIRQEYSEKGRLKIIEQYTTHNEGPRLESNHPSAWFTRFLRLANAMYSHRISTNRDQEFVLPRDETRRLFRAYNQVLDLRIEEEKLQRVLDVCARNGNTAIDEALKLLSK